MITEKTLQKKRKELKISQTELARRIGISRPTLVKIEQGERKFTKDEKEKVEAVFASLADLGEATQGSEMRVNIPEKNLEKFEQVLLYILEKVGAKPNVGMTVLYKLLYFIDFDYYEKYEHQLMGLTYFRNTHGPAPREFKKVVDKMEKEGGLEKVRSSYFSHEQKKFLPKKEADLSLLTGRELEMIDSVLDRYSDKSATQISDLAHRDMPWKATKEGQDIEYELAFYRSEEFSVGEYEPV